MGRPWGDWLQEDDQGKQGRFQLTLFIKVLADIKKICCHVQDDKSDNFCKAKFIREK